MEGQGSITYGQVVTWSNIPGKPSPTVQFMFVVGGPNNFASIPGAPAVPGNGAASMTTNLISGLAVRMSRNGLWQMGFDPMDGNSFYTKVLASNVINFNGPLSTGEEIIIETIPL